MAVYIGQGVTLAVDKTGSGTFTTLAQFTSFDGPSRSVGSIETTNLSSVSKEYRPGVPDAGEVSGTLQFDAADTNQTFLMGLTTAPAILDWKLTFPTTTHATIFSFSGFLTDFSIAPGEIEDVTTADVTIKITGPITVSTAS